MLTELIRYPWPLLLSLCLFVGSLAWAQSKNITRWQMTLLLFLNALQFALITGLRLPGSGFDTPRYVAVFSASENESLTVAIARHWSGFRIGIFKYDSGFNVLTWVISRFTGDERVYLVAVNLINVLLTVLSLLLRKELSGRQKLFALFYFCFSYTMLLQYGNTIRQGLAIGLLQLAWSLLVRGGFGWIPATLLFAGAAEVHLFTASLFLVVVIASYLVKLFVPTMRTLALLSVCAFLVSFLVLFGLSFGPLGGVISGKIQNFASQGLNPELYLRIFFIVFVLFVAFRRLGRSPDLFYYAAVVFLCLCAMNTSEAVKRAIPLAMIVEPVLVVRTLGAMNETRGTQWYATMAFSAFALALTLTPPIFLNFRF